MPSPEASRRNLELAKACGRPPRPWRSSAESRLIRLFVWQWLLGRGPRCSQRALARWLVVSHTYVQKVSRTLPRDEHEFLREARGYGGPPTLASLQLARDESRQLRQSGSLRRPRLHKRVEYRIGDQVVSWFVKSKPSVIGLGEDNPVSPPPTDNAHEKFNSAIFETMRLARLKELWMQNEAARRATQAKPVPFTRRWRPRGPF